MLMKIEPIGEVDWGWSPFQDVNSRLSSRARGIARRAKHTPKRFSCVISAPMDSKSMASSTS